MTAASAVLGVASAIWMVRAIVAIGPSELARLETASIDRVVLLFTMAMAVVCTVVLSVLAAWRVQPGDLDGSSARVVGARGPDRAAAACSTHSSSASWP